MNTEIRVLEEASKRGHEQLCIFNYPRVGLKALVGIHNTVLGPSLGGCRMRLYESEDEAIDDVLRLSEGMTYKSSLAGLDLGGGKSCIIVDPELSGEARRDLFLQFAHCLNHLGGRYITAEDMGTSVADVSVMREVSKYAAGYAKAEGGSGDPSPWTALGVYHSILAAAERQFGSKDLTGKKISIQGVGHVGLFLAEHLKKAGADLFVCDTRQEKLEEAKKRFELEVVDLEQIYDVDCDIYAPCAIGQTVNPDTIPRLQCKVIAGAANNILSDRSVYPLLQEKGILYCPDFVINSGGVISVGAEYNPGGWNEDWVREKVENIYNTIHKILDKSEQEDRFPEDVSIDIAKERIAAAEEKLRK